MSEMLASKVKGSPFIRRFIRSMSTPQKVMGSILFVLLVFFIFLPAVNLVYTAFTYSFSDRVLPQVLDRGLKAVPGKFTLVHFERVFASVLTKRCF